MVFRSNTRSPSVLRSNMLIQRILQTLSPVEVLPISSPGHRIVTPEKTACTELRQQEINDVLERLREQNVALISISAPR